MKFTFVVPFLISLGFSNLFFCQSIQSEKITTDGVFEKVFNRFGDSIALSKIIIDPKDGVTQKALGPLCSSGYFDLYFEIGSGMEGNSTVELARRAVICQVFSDLSQFIQTPNPNVHVNILIKNINTELPGYNPSINSNPSATSNVLGLASAYYLAPSVNSTTTGGIIDNEVWKTINTGVDSYSGVMSPFLLDPTNQNNFGLYHGYMAINFNNPTINWHTDLSQNTSTGLYDLYTVVLHEVTHALGFASLIDENGNSKFGVGYPYYSRFDKFLHTNTNIPIILNQGNCSMYSFGLNPNLNSSVLHPIAQDCSNQIRYIGAINQAAYTPAVFENGSSLSHLFDECHLPNYYTINEYYTMSYANGTGLVYMKRYLKPEERSVLCDLGYQVNSSFGNPNNLNYYDYNSTTCTGLGVYGVNDGIDVNGFVEFITPVNNPNGPTFSGIVSNDINADHFECLQVVYGNGIPSTTSGTSFQFYSTTPGFVVLRYIPVSSSNIRGNITYVYVYVSQSNCTPTTCNYVNNGDFELTTDCGEIGSSPLNNTACWIPYTCSPDLFLRNCTNPFSTWGTTFDIPATYASNNPFEAWNGFINNSFMGMGSNVYNYHESIQTKLNIPLLNGHIYKISLYARCGDNYGAPILPLGYNGELLIGGAVSQLSPTCSPQTIAPSGIVQLGDIFAVANDLNWHHLEQTFQYNGQVNLNQLIIYNYSNISQLNGFHNVYIYIDQVEITEVQPNLNLNLPSSICLNQQINDLSIYAPVSGGYFNGPGITLSGNTYSFNPSLAGIGIHTISYTYTNNLNCTISIEDEIEVINSNFTISATTNNSSICIGQDVLLSANSSTPATYTWNPGNIPGPVLIATPNTSTLYTLTATSNQGCVENLSIPVTVNPLPNIQVNPEITTICEGQSVQLSASGAESYVWSPNNYLSNLTGSVTTA